MKYMEKKSKLRKLRAKEWRELKDNHSPWSIWKKKGQKYEKWGVID